MLTKYLQQNTSYILSHSSIGYVQSDIIFLGNGMPIIFRRRWLYLSIYLSIYLSRQTDKQTHPARHLLPVLLEQLRGHESRSAHRVRQLNVVTGKLVADAKVCNLHGKHQDVMYHESLLTIRVISHHNGALLSVINESY